MHDYSEYQKPQSGDGLAQLSELAEVQLKRQQAVTKAEVALERAEEELRLIAEVAIPEAMDALGMEEFTTTSGLKIKVVEKIRASILVDHKIAAFQWLRDNGHAALIKRIVKVQFGMGEDAEAQKAVEALEGLPVEDESNVHWQTLAKFAREVLADGQDIPEELFSINRQRVSNVSI